MKTTKWSFLLIALIFSCSSATQPENPEKDTTPTPTKKFRSGIFIHHSTGGNIWSQDGANRSIPKEIDLYNASNNYKGDEAISMKEEWWKPIDNEWYTIDEFIKGNKKFTDINKYVKENSVIVIKTCFPASDIQSMGSHSDTSNPTYKSVYNYKWHWRNIIKNMEKYPDNFFAIWTNAPLEKNSTNLESAKRSQLFCKWAKDTLAQGKDAEYGKFPSNVYVFDFFEKLTDNNGLMKDQYRASVGDSHPNAKATELVAPQFVKEIFDAAIQYEKKRFEEKK